jgi:hypothetical protein
MVALVKFFRAEPLTHADTTAMPDPEENAHIAVAVGLKNDV